MMGPCGCGKTTVGTALAERLGGAFIEGDEFHPQTNRAKMSAGEPLSDADRWPWLDLIGDELRRQSQSAEIVVLACSALKRSYRDRLRQADPKIVFVLLNGTKQLLMTRLEERHDHFMPPALLESQLEALETPDEDERAVLVDVAQSPEDMIDEILTHALVESR